MQSFSRPLLMVHLNAISHTHPLHGDTYTIIYCTIVKLYLLASYENSPRENFVGEVVAVAAQRRSGGLLDGLR